MMRRPPRSTLFPYTTSSDLTSDVNTGSESKISRPRSIRRSACSGAWMCWTTHPSEQAERSEEHTSELQSLTNLVCRLLLEKKKLTRLGRALRNRQRLYTAVP